MSKSRDKRIAVQRELKPCPFCGGYPDVSEENGKYGCYCMRCGAMPYGFRWITITKAQEAWNWRVDEKAEEH